MKTHRDNLEMNTPIFFTEGEKSIAELYYRRGVEFEKKWYEIKAMNPPLNVWVLLKEGVDNYCVMKFFKLNRGADIMFAKNNYTHWRLIDVPY